MSRYFKLKATTFVPDPALDWLRAGDVFIGETVPNRPGLVQLAHPTDPGKSYAVRSEDVDEVS